MPRRIPKLAVHEIKSSRMTWVNVTRPGQEELAALRRRFHFLDIDLKECPPPLQRPKLVDRPDYLFMILFFPLFDRETGTVRPAEVDFFIGKNFLVSVHANKLPLIEKTFTHLQNDRKKRASVLKRDPGALLYQLLDSLLDECFPMLVHLSRDIDRAESFMNNMHNPNTIRELFRIKTNIVNFKKCIQPHKHVIRKLTDAAPRFFSGAILTTYFSHLVDHTKEIWDSLQSFTETINAIEDGHVSMLNFRTNNIIRVLTLFAVIVFPLTLIASIFSMNTNDIPIVGRPYDFWIIIGLMLAGTLGMLTYFKLKKWF